MRLKLYIPLFILCFFSLTLSAQSISAQDLSQINVAELSDSQIAEISAQFEARGVSEEQGLQLLQERGMPAAEAELLKKRLEEVSMSGKGGNLPPSTPV